MPFTYFREGESQVFTFYFQGSRVSRRITPCRIHIFLPHKAKGAIRKQKQASPLNHPEIIEKHYIQMARGNRNNSSITEQNIVSACQLGFSGISGPPANLPRTRELLSLSPNLNLSPVEQLSSHEIILFLFFGIRPTTMAEP